jgi:MoxR-like ATPase
VFQRAAKALAYIEGRNFVVPKDVQELAVPVLAHRVILKPSFRMKGVKAADIIKTILSSIEEPPFQDGEP